MTLPIRVLLLEDSVEDATLVLEELRRGGFETISQRVETLDAMTEALAEKWDVILSDFRVGGFSFYTDGDSDRRPVAILVREGKSWSEPHLPRE